MPGLDEALRSRDRRQRPRLRARAGGARPPGAERGWQVDPDQADHRTTLAHRGCHPRLRSEPLEQPESSAPHRLLPGARRVLEVPHGTAVRDDPGRTVAYGVTRRQAGGNRRPGTRWGRGLHGPPHLDLFKGHAAAHEAGPGPRARTGSLGARRAAFGHGSRRSPRADGPDRRAGSGRQERLGVESRHARGAGHDPTLSPHLRGACARRR